jgi:Domain of unknown function (DUF4129)
VPTTLPDLSTVAIRRALDSVLSAHEFQAPEPSPLARLLHAIGSWVWGGLSRAADWLLARVSVTSPAWHAVGRIALLVLAAVGVWVIVRLTSILLASRRRAEGARRAETGARDHPRTAADWEAAAREASLRHRWREASVALYHAVVLRLAADGHVGFSDAKTPGDYRREIADHSSLGAPVAAFLHTFERVAFARAQPGEREYTRLRELAGPVVTHG